MDYVYKYAPAHLLGLMGVIFWWNHETTAGAVMLVGSMLLTELVSQRRPIEQPQRDDYIRI